MVELSKVIFWRLIYVKSLPKNFLSLAISLTIFHRRSFLKFLRHRDQVEQVVCMLQKEVADRIAAPPGSKTYGILSVLLQAYYNIQYLVQSSTWRVYTTAKSYVGCDPSQNVTLW